MIRELADSDQLDDLPDFAIVGVPMGDRMDDEGRYVPFHYFAIQKEDDLWFIMGDSTTLRSIDIPQDHFPLALLWSRDE